MRRRTILFCTLFVSIAARADAPKLALPQLFPQRAEVAITTPGLQSLEVPLEVLRACRPGLSDLRLWSDDAEIPYLVDTTGPDAWTLAEKIDVRPGRIRQDRKAPLCDPSRTVDTAHCESIDFEGPKKGTSWELVFDTTSPRFVERVELAARRGDKLESILHGESVYRLTQGPGERVRIALPDAAVGAHLTIILQGDGSPLSPKLRLERGTTVRGTAGLAAPLAIASEWRDGDGTHLVVDRPRGLLPTALTIDTRTSAFDRQVRVYDVTDGVDTRQLIGEGRVSRVSLPAAGERVAIDQVEIPIAVARLRRLELVIDDGDSPRLEALAVRALVRRPVLIFSRDQAGSVELYFGGGRAEAPRYDLQSLLPQSPDDTEGAREVGVRAEVAARLRERTGIARVSLGPLASNSRFDATPALASVAHAGAPIEVALYAKSRALTVPSSPESLSRYVLQPADLAAARPDVEDLRVIDDAGRQWPYLIDRDVAAAVLSIETVKASSHDGKTRYEVPLPVSPLSIGRIDLDIKEGFFNREAAIIGTDEAGRERRFENVRVTRKLGHHGAVQLPMSLPRQTTLSIEIIDGGDAPLTIERVHLRIATMALQLVAVAGRYRLVAGNPDAEPASYELRSLESVVAQLDAAQIHADALLANPAYSASARLRAGGARERVLVWLVLGAAVLILGFLTLRMARGEGAAGTGKEGQS